MQLTILGCYSPYPPVGGALSGYLVQHNDTTLLLDAGSGVASRLQQYVAIENLTAVVISHLHEDHISDVHCLRYMQGAAQMLGRTEQKLQIYAPAEPVDKRAWIAGDLWQHLYTYDALQPLVLGDLEIQFTCTDHPLPTYAMRIRPVGQEGPVLFYTADTAVSEAVTRAAEGADLLLVEASLVEEFSANRRFGHLTAAEAAAMARDAGVKRCMFTHIWPGIDPQRLLDEGRSVHANIELVKEGKSYRVG